ncbi:hypothetical protein [Tautonia sociabilis]|uniref:Uncharacterized protein n=1 Tax=Tautonia sociabilis TaxID=2080755 RepID=A0A432MPQ4_9BACT|nr:hypothetical protein [Tautonia sociabilis]RUL89453.1 hypothetical protein TsocGM_01385 [Tautonia sociabilis]
MHAERYRAAERADAAACPGFEPIETPAGTGCRHCSGLPADHPSHPAGPAAADRKPSLAHHSREGDGDEVQGTLF